MGEGRRKFLAIISNLHDDDDDIFFLSESRIDMEVNRSGIFCFVLLCLWFWINAERPNDRFAVFILCASSMQSGSEAGRWWQFNSNIAQRPLSIASMAMRNGMKRLNAIDAVAIDTNTNIPLYIVRCAIAAAEESNFAILIAIYCKCMYIHLLRANLWLQPFRQYWSGLPVIKSCFRPSPTKFHLQTWTNEHVFNGIWFKVSENFSSPRRAISARAACNN